VRDQVDSYRERLRVPVRWWIQGNLMLGSFWLAMIVVLPERLTWILTAGLFLLLAFALMSYGGARITLTEGWLQVGRARIETRFVGAVVSLDQVEMREVSGPGADARAHLELRPYLSRGVQIEILDPADPAPYWLVSSRRPTQLAVVLASASPKSSMELVQDLGQG